MNDFRDRLSVALGTLDDIGRARPEYAHRTEAIAVLLREMYYPIQLAEAVEAKERRQ